MFLNEILKKSHPAATLQRIETWVGWERGSYCRERLAPSAPSRRSDCRRSTTQWGSTSRVTFLRAIAESKYRTNYGSLTPDGKCPLTVISYRGFGAIEVFANVWKGTGLG